MLRNILLFSKKLLLASFLFVGVNVYSNTKGLPLQYYKIEDSEKQKEYFLNYLNKMVLEENMKIIEEREFVKSVLFSNILKINFESSQFRTFLEIKNKYKIKELFSPNLYLKRIDIIPPSMALAQAAIESGWGKSRFTKEANNIFGHWTYNSNIGMLPENREIGATHFIRIFKNLNASISAYMLNLNRNLAYSEFREKRFIQRLKQQNPDGLSLSETMLNYSGIANEYLSMLKNMITTNKLLAYDTNFYTNLK